MNARLLLIITFFSLIGCSGFKDSTQTTPPPATAEETTTDTEALLSYQDEITTNYLRPRLAAFSADSMEGRETAMPGQKKAAEYLSQEYKKLGMKPVGDNNSYLQKFELTAERTDSVVFMTHEVGEDSTKKEYVSKSVNSKNTSANYIQQLGSTNKIDGEIIFAGFGLQNEKLNIDHLKGVDIKGKWIMVLGGELPKVIDGDTLYTDANAGQFVQGWLRNILQKEVAGIIQIFTKAQEFEEIAKTNQQAFGKPSGMQLAYRAQERGGRGWSLNTIHPAHAAKLLGLTGVDALIAKKEEVIKNIKTFSPENTGYGLTQIPYVTDVTLESENVAALMEGADPHLKDEVVVLSAHYDHVGIGAPDSTGDAIYNGANDDGSGTIGILGAARAFAKAKENGVRPRRSILFLSVSGEEKGLLGSRYYSDHPIYPMEKTVANINTDMIGRVDPEHQKSGNSDYVYIIGADIISSDIDSLLKAGNRRSGNLELDMRYNDLEDPNQFYRRSDHWNFGRLGVPFVFFFNGVHEDYHRPSDEIEKMNFDLMTKTARSMYATTVMIANADSVPKVDNQEFIEITREN